jgi:hypothetical protein
MIDLYFNKDCPNSVLHSNLSFYFFIKKIFFIILVLFYNFSFASDIYGYLLDISNQKDYQSYLSFYKTDQIPITSDEGGFDYCIVLNGRLMKEGFRAFVDGRELVLSPHGYFKLKIALGSKLRTFQLSLRDLGGATLNYDFSISIPKWDERLLRSNLSSSFNWRTFNLKFVSILNRTGSIQSFLFSYNPFFLIDNMTIGSSIAVIPIRSIQNSILFEIQYGFFFAYPVFQKFSIQSDIGMQYVITRGAHDPYFGLSSSYLFKSEKYFLKYISQISIGYLRVASSAAPTSQWSVGFGFQF